MRRLHLFLVGCTLAAVFCNASSCKNKQNSAETKPAETAAPAQAETPPAAEPSAVKDDRAHVLIRTKFGTMEAVLYNETPKHRDNFLKLASEKYYDGLLFHRCIPNFMIQGGDPNSRGAAPSQMLGSGGPGYTVPAEFNPALYHKKGALCAARQGDQVNPTRASSGSQFYIVKGQTWTDMQLSQIESNINYKSPGFKYTEEQRQTYKTTGGTAQLDMDYTVFGEIVKGLDILDSVLVQPTKRDRPVNDVTMTMEVLSLPSNK